MKSRLIQIIAVLDILLGILLIALYEKETLILGLILIIAGALLLFIASKKSRN